MNKSVRWVHSVYTHNGYDVMVNFLRDSLLFVMFDCTIKSNLAILPSAAFHRSIIIFDVYTLFRFKKSLRQCNYFPTTTRLIFN